MFPAYGYTHAYPQGSAQMSADYHHHHAPSEGLPPQMKVGASPSPFPYETWPHHYGYPVPTQCHSCCNQNAYPGHYAYRPPYPHFPSSPLHPQCCGSYPVYPEPYPFQYAPPPHYTMEIPKYEYDKSAPRDFHCCGCHHHKPDMKGDNKGVKIEEHESDADNKEDSLIPSGFNKIAWIPKERTSGAKPHQCVQSSLQEPKVWNGWPPLDYESIRRILEGGDERRSRDPQSNRWASPGEREAANHQEGPSVVMPQHDLKKSVGQEPNPLSGWMPLDVDSLKKLLQNDHLRRDHNDQPRNEGHQMPLDVDSLKKLFQNGDLRRDYDDQPRNKGIHQMPFPVVWLPHNNEEKDKTMNERGVSPASEQGDDHTLKSIPTVRPEGSEEGKASVEKSDKPPKTILVKQMDEPADMKTSNGVRAKSIEESKKSTENGTKNKSTLPTKASKFTPVCLRVDPLPKKKTKSSSTSENKVHQETKGQQREAEKKSVEVPQGKKEINIVDMDGRSHNVEIERSSKRAGERKEVEQKAVEKKHEEDLKLEKRILSGTEAATIIQSAYRGYEVRRLEPLKKMRQIANIRDEAAAVKSRIESGASSTDLKQKTALGETIMNLLLKLDTVQGLHPSIRDFRKSAVKELVSLQEMLDAIVVKQPDHSPEDTKGTKGVGTTIQIPDESSQSPGISEAEAKAGETEVQTADESSRNSGLSGIEDQHGGIRQPDHSPEDTRAVVDTMQTPDESSQSIGISEAVVTAEAGETEVQTADESSMNSGLRGTEDQHGVEEPSTVPDLLSGGMTPEQALVDKEPERDTFETGATGIGVEDGSPLSESHELNGQESSPVITDKASVEPIEQVLSPVVTEVHVDSVDQTDGLLAELPVAVLEEDGPETNICSDAEKIQEMNVDSELAQTLDEGSETPLTEPEQQEPNEASKGTIPTEQDTESVTLQNVHVPDNDGELLMSEIAASVQSEKPFEVGDQAPVANENTGENKADDNTHEETECSDETTKQIVHEEVDAKPAEDDRLSAVSSIEDATKEDKCERRTMEENDRMRNLLEKLVESEKQQQEVINSLSEKLKELEGKLAKQKKKKMARTRKAKVLMPRSCKTLAS